MTSAVSSAATTTQAVLTDASARRPVLGFFLSATAWLGLGALLALAASIKLVAPGFLDGIGALTYGRVWPTALNWLAYGWCGLGLAGASVWILTRLSQRPLQVPALPLASLALWNVGLLWGGLAILSGMSTGITWLEFPAIPAGTIALALILLAAWAGITVICRDAPAYLSQTLIVVGLIGFATVYAGANLILLGGGVPGYPALGVQNWYARNAFGLGLAPLALAAIAYVVPKALGRPLFGYSLATFGAWSFLLSFNLLGPYHLIAKPPGFLVAISSVAALVATFGVLAITLSLFFTVIGSGAFRHNPAVRFATIGVLTFPLACLMASLQDAPGVAWLTKYTLFGTGQIYLILAFASAALFGAIYAAVPRLTGREWASVQKIRLHFWGFIGGSALAWLGFTLRGLAQGSEINNLTAFATIRDHSFAFYAGQVIALAAIVAGTLAFGILLVQNVAKIGSLASVPASLENLRAERRPRTLQAMYRRVFASLFLVLGAEYAIATGLRGLGTLPLTIILCLLALAYVVLVAWYLMYLKFEGRWVFAMIVPTCLIATVLVAAIYPDVAMPYSIHDQSQQDEEAALAEPPHTAVPAVNTVVN